MKMRYAFRQFLFGCLVAPAVVSATAADIQDFPKKPLHFVVPFGAGSTTDQAARFIGNHITKITKQPVIVENKPGANGFIGIQYLLSQPADGYTIVITTSTTHAANPSLFKKLPYDPVADFVPVSNIAIGSMVLAVAPAMPAKNVQELIALAKQRPGKLTFGSGNSSSRAGGEMLKDLAHIDLLHVPYKTLPNAITDLIGGQVDMVFGDAPAILPHVRAGTLRALGVSTSNRMPSFKDIPTIEEQGVPGYELSGWVAAFAPKGTPPEVADKLNNLIANVMKSPEAAKFFRDNAWEPNPGSREGLAQFQRTEIARWSKLIKAARIEPE
jgi:tripartite-type tricarboxylate transporter receptor subunit TctC